MKFAGIDLGWVSGASGTCCLEWRGDRLHLLALDRLDTIADVLAWCDRWLESPSPGAIAVDAPTLIPNASGMRLPDKLAHQHFGRYHAGCYPANLGRPFARRTLDFGLSLETRGFRHAPAIAPQHPGRYQIEVFPHAAIVNLFDLDRILKYKKGRLDSRKLELGKLYEYVLAQLPLLTPSLDLGDRFPAALGTDDASFLSLKGTELKAVEDKLDSTICAYIAAYWWYWGTAKNRVLGDLSSGYIVVPERRSQR